jgi:peptidoglycan/xylan/chitin deacetylase (PgdA/CDA1 family)
VRFFCYPSGDYDDRTIRVLHSVGYWGAVVVTWGDAQRADALFEMPRVRMRGRYDGADLERLLDWLASQHSVAQ